jgi:hypothetical protein
MVVVFGCINQPDESNLPRIYLKKPGKGERSGGGEKA